MVKALIFDVFGTLVDWRSSIARESRLVLEPLGYKLDWDAFADAWRGRYQPTMEEVRSGRIPFSKLDTLHRINLDYILPRHDVKPLPEETLRHLNNAWHRLDAWPEVPEALRRLRKKFLLAPCSNGNIALMADLARRNDIWWDAILGSDVARDYKPKPIVYLASCDAFNLTPGEVMMVAAHSSDLAAAAEQGLKTGFIGRPNEHGPGKGETKPATKVDYAGSDLADLATQLSC
ncbi:haloacid dehalogenase type II [Variibacter gotjawalensis]|nr:haloacid dehalogenase type II [Variibacter gotjawalensis]NIK48266.1 2-haloacid dehalogenase [Variibacter gotjawalensis]